MNNNPQSPASTIEAIQSFAKAPSPNVTKITGYHEGGFEIGTGLDSNCVLWVAEGAHMKGNAVASQIYCEGRIEGSVRAKVVTLEKNGSIDGAIACSYLLVQHPKEVQIAAKISNLNPQHQSQLSSSAPNQTPVTHQSQQTNAVGSNASFQQVDTTTGVAP
jgi:cytoskeletal protein CcmA (bactofilin family)